LMFGAATLAMACGGSAGSDPMKPAPNPMADDYCAVQHDGGGIVVCDQLYPEAPFVHLPAATATPVIARLQIGKFGTADGTTYPYSLSAVSADPEQQRHALALYELELSGSTVTSFHPVVQFDESLFVKPFMGQAFEGTISRRVGGTYANETTLPV